MFSLPFLSTLPVEPCLQNTKSKTEQQQPDPVLKLQNLMQDHAEALTLLLTRHD